ncbi:MAG: hypothetical protein LBN21_10555 [Treponema sp.]|jgi:hypothetical protein|nr:hypothetical protein [Treponema sp.]
MFKKKYGFGENEFEHFPDGFKLPKMPLPSELKKTMEDKQPEKDPDSTDNGKGNGDAKQKH